MGQFCSDVFRGQEARISSERVLQLMKHTMCPKQGLKLIRHKYSKGNDLHDSSGCIVLSVRSDPARLR